MDFKTSLVEEPLLFQSNYRWKMARRGFDLGDTFGILRVSIQLSLEDGPEAFADVVAQELAGMFQSNYRWKMARRGSPGTATLTSVIVSIQLSLEDGPEEGFKIGGHVWKFRFNPTIAGRWPGGSQIMRAHEAGRMFQSNYRWKMARRNRKFCEARTRYSVSIQLSLEDGPEATGV